MRVSLTGHTLYLVNWGIKGGKNAAEGGHLVGLGRATLFSPTRLPILIYKIMVNLLSLSSTPFHDQFQNSAVEFQILQMDFRSLPLIEHQISKTPFPYTLLCILVRSQEYSRDHLLK